MASTLFPQKQSAKKSKRQSQSIVMSSAGVGGGRHQYSQSVLGLESIAEENTSGLFQIVTFEDKQKQNSQYIVQDYLPAANTKMKQQQYLAQDDFFFTMDKNNNEETKSTSRYDLSQQPIQDSSKLMIDTMLQDCKNFLVRGREHPYQENDSIFQLCQPSIKINQNDSGKCHVCLVSFKALKSVSYCDFCGYQCCKTTLCLVKTRPFPNNQSLKGQVCQICDRKFYIRQQMTDTLSQIENKRYQISQLQLQMIKKSDDCKAIEEEIEMYKEINQEEVTRVEKSVIEVQKQKDVLRQEIASINDDYKSQYSKKQAIDDEMKFLEDTMDDINADMEVRDEEILKVRIRIRQMDIEKDKLEAQMQHLRRQISKNHQSRGKNAQQKPNSSPSLLNNPDQAEQTITPSNKQLLGSKSQLKQSNKEDSSSAKKKEEGDEMFFHHASEEESIDYLQGSTTQLPKDYQLYRSTIGAVEEETQGNEEDNNHLPFGGISAKKLAKKKRRDNQSFCGTPNQNSKCHIF